MVLSFEWIDEQACEKYNSLDPSQSEDIDADRERILNAKKAVEGHFRI